MTFETALKETEVELIPEVYDIYSGNYVWRYTSAKIAVTFLGNSYIPAPIKRGSFSDDRKGVASCSITLPISDPILTYLSSFPMPSVQIRIHQLLSSDPSQYNLLMDGKVKRVNIRDNMATAEVETPGVLRSRLPHIVYQSYCNWIVFDCNCGLDQETWVVEAEVSVGGTNNEVLYSPSFGVRDDGYFTQGKVYVDGNWRFITNHVEQAITLHVPFSSDELVTGTYVKVYPGCDGSPNTCRNKFNNFTARWCGMKNIPSHNPVLWGFK